jgi:hypothetical protein
MADETWQTFTVYTTLGDETWDQVALKVYGAERFANVLMRANPVYGQLVFFDSGMVLILPQLTTVSNVARQSWNTTYQYS